MKVRLPSLSDLMLSGLHVVFFFALLGIYLFGVVPVFGDQGFEDAFNDGNLLVAMALLATTMPFLRSRGLPSDCFLNYAVLFVVTPSLVIYVGSGLPDRYAITTVFAFVLVGLIARSASLTRVKIVAIRRDTLLSSMVAIALGTVCSILALGGAKFLNFDFTAVYEIRTQASENLPSFYGYLNSVVGTSIIPLGIVLAIVRNRWGAVSLLVGASFLLFGLTAHKSLVFFPLALIAVYVVSGSRKMMHHMLVAMIVLVGVSAIDLWWFIDTGAQEARWFSSLFTRRALLVPALLDWHYLDFFSDGIKYYWANSKLTFGLLTPPYDLSPPNLIGSVYFGREEMAANTGWIGSGYANAGLIGIISYSLAIGLLLSYLDSNAKVLGNRLVTSLFTLQILILLTSSDLLTTLLTHGMLLSLILLSLIGPDSGR